METQINGDTLEGMIRQLESLQEARALLDREIERITQQLDSALGAAS